MTAGGQQDHGSKQDAGRQAGAGRLGALLQDLALTHGRVRTAELLGVNYRTLARSLESGELTETMQQALERYAVELPVDGEAPEDGALPDDDVLTMDGPHDDVLSTDDPVEVNEAALLRQEVAALREEVAQSVGRYEERLEERFEERLARLERGGAGQDQAASATPQPAPPRGGIHPQVVTVEPMGMEDEMDEKRVYRSALPLVAEWREVRGCRERAAHTLEYLQAQERLMQLEIALVDEHRLTLPPDTYPWDGIRRHAELRLRRRVLKRVRRQRRWTWLLHWSARLLTLGLWGR